MTRGRIRFADRVQRLILGGLLLLINIMGMTESVDWKNWVAFVLQLELLGTALAGWCPITLACHLGSQTNPN